MSVQIFQTRVLQAAHELMSVYGVHSMTMDELATRLGTSKKTIYKYFPGKDEIVEAVVSQVLQANRTRFEDDFRKSENAVHELILAIDRVVEMLDPMHPSVLFELRKYHAGAFLSIQRHKQDFLFEIMKKNLIRGIREGLFRPGIKPETMARFRVESMMLLFEPEFSKNHKVSLSELQSSILEHYLFGLVTIKGYKLVEKYLKKNKILT